MSALRKTIRVLKLHQSGSSAPHDNDLESAAPPTAVAQLPARRPFIVGLAIVITALIAANGYYFFRSQSPTFWDDSSYLLGSLNLHDALTEHGVSGFGTTFAHLFGNKAPLISALPVPVYLLLGRDGDPRFLVSIGFLIVMSVYLFRVGERLWSPREGLLAVVILQTMPLMYGLSRQFLADYGLATLVVMWMYYFLGFRLLNKTGIIVRLGIVLGAGLLLKVTFPLYVVAPTLLIIWVSLLEATSVREALRLAQGLAYILLIGVGISASWYLFNWRAILGFAGSAAFGRLANDYGSTDVFSPEVVWEYLAKISIVGISCYYSILFLLLLALWAVSTWPRILKPSRRSLTLLLWASVPLAVVTFSVNKDPRYAAPFMPVIALGLARLMSDVLDRRMLLRKVAVASLLIPILAYSVSSLPALSALGEFRIGRWVIWSPHLWWYASVPDDAGAWGQREIVETICHESERLHGGNRVLIPLSHQYLNNSNLAYLSSRLKCDLQIIGLSQQFRSPKEVSDWMQGVKPSYVLVVPSVPEPELAPPFANSMKEEAERIVTRSDSGFDLMYRGSLGTTGKEILIYRRIANGT